MPRRRDKMHGGIPQVERKMTDRLHRIAVKDSAVHFAQFANRMDIQDIPDLIVGMHQRHQRLIGAARQFVFKVFKVDMTIRQHLQIAHGSLAPFVKVLYCM
jgi:hypothetical protein